MGKYNQEFDRNSRDFYPTISDKPSRVLLTHLLKTGELKQGETLKYMEPCAGDGALIKHFDSLAKFYGIDVKCQRASDIYPSDNKDIEVMDILDFEPALGSSEIPNMFITNPPWINSKGSGYLLNSLISHMSSITPTWVLLNGTYVWNLKSAENMKFCSDVVPIGRLKWIKDSLHMGKEDCAWFRFQNKLTSTIVHPRVKV